MSQKTGKRREIIVMTVGTLVSAVVGGFVAGGSISPFKGLVFGIGFGCIMGLLSRRWVMSITLMGTGFLVYMYLTPFLRSLINL